jgi:hypothetical protein
LLALLIMYHVVKEHIACHKFLQQCIVFRVESFGLRDWHAGERQLVQQCGFSTERIKLVNPFFYV